MRKLRHSEETVNEKVGIKQLFREMFPDHYRHRGNSLCPFHEDTNPSLSLAKGNGAHCFGACQRTYSVIDLYRKAKGCNSRRAVQELAERFGIANDPNLNARLESKRTILAVYQYRDEDGNVLFENVRFRPKEFRMRRPKGDGRYAWSLKGCRRVPYRLPQLISDQEVWLCEGEKDADRAASLGFTATCFPLGAGKNRQELIKAHKMDIPFSDKRVTILPDNDETGRAYAMEVAKTLLPLAATVKVLDLKTIWPELPEKGDVSDLIEHMGKEIARNELQSLAEDTCPLERSKTTEANDSGQDQTASGEKKSRFQSLKDAFFQSGGTAFLDQHENACVTVQHDGAFKNLKIDSKAFDRYMLRLHVDMHGDAVGDETIKAVRRYLEASATERRELFNRFASSDEEVWIDSGNDQWDAFHVTALGWTVEKSPAPPFYRKQHQQPLPMPRGARDLTDLFSLLPIKREGDRILFMVWLVIAPLAHIPRPLIILTGPPGSGKSLCCEFVRSLLDPSSVATVPLSKDHTEFVQMMNSHALIMLDNVRKIPSWASDALCRAVCGGGFTKRMLHTDEDDILWHFRRTGIINSIHRPVCASDVLDRSIHIELERIADDERQDCRSLVKRFDEMRPGLFGSLLDTLSRTIATRPAVHVDRLPRMADWCLFGSAAADALGFGGERFRAAYFGNIKRQCEQSLSSDAVAITVREFIESETTWRGPVSQLYKLLSKLALKLGLGSEWPKAPHILSCRLREITLNLERAGIRISFSRTKHHNIILLEKTIPRVSQHTSSAPHFGSVHDGADQGQAPVGLSGQSEKRTTITSNHNHVQIHANEGGGTGGASPRFDHSCLATGSGCQGRDISYRNEACLADHEEPGGVRDPGSMCPITGAAR